MAKETLHHPDPIVHRIYMKISDGREELYRSLKPETNLVKDLGYDSLEFLGLVGELETEFEMEVPEGDLLTLVTVKDLIGYVKRRIGGEQTKSSDIL